MTHQWACSPLITCIVIAGRGKFAWSSVWTDLDGWTELHQLCGSAVFPTEGVRFLTSEENVREPKSCHQTTVDGAVCLLPVGPRCTLLHLLRMFQDFSWCFATGRRSMPWIKVGILLWWWLLTRDTVALWVSLTPAGRHLMVLGFTKSPCQDYRIC